MSMLLHLNTLDFLDGFQHIDSTALKIEKYRCCIGEKYLNSSYMGESMRTGLKKNKTSAVGRWEMNHSRCLV